MADIEAGNGVDHPTNDVLTSKQLVGHALAGRLVQRPAVGPLAVHYCARLAGVSIRDYTSNSRILADCVLCYYERFRPDAVWLSADTWVTAQAMGAAVDFPDDNQPMGSTGEPLVRNAADVDRIPLPDPSSQGRCPLMVEALGRVREMLDDKVFVVACFDQYPFSLACALMGIDQLMMKLIDDRPMVDALLARCSEYAVAYGRALSDAGADLLSGGDSPAGLVGPERYHEIVAPFEKQVIGRLRAATGKPVSLHICGDATPLLIDMAASGADVLELDHKVDAARACQVVGRDVAIWGNIDPVGVLAHGTPQEVHAATCNLLKSLKKADHRRYVVSSGCTLAMETPSENLQAMISAIREFEIN